MKAIIPVLLVCPFLSGCIAWEIRDEVRAANAQLCQTNPALVHTLHQLAEVDQDIKQTNTQLTDVHAGLMQTNTQLADVQTGLMQTNTRLADVQAGLTLTNTQLAAIHAELQRTNERMVAVTTMLETTQPKLTDLDGGLTRMRVIDEVNVSLKQVEKELDPLIKSLGMVGSAASFLGLGGGGDADVLAREDAPAPPAGSAPAPAAGAPPVAAAPDAPPAAPKEDLLVGTWMLVYPPPPPPQRFSKVVIITAGGAFLEAEPGKPLVQGQWSRTHRTLTFRRTAGVPGQASADTTVELITLSARTLTLRLGEDIKVYAKP